MIKELPSQKKVNDCWTNIGIQGNATCPELKQLIHCRNCPAYATAAVILFEREVPPEYIAEWTLHLSKKKEIDVPGLLSVLVFRISQEWYALETRYVREITEEHVVHHIPHCKTNFIKGLVNIHGKIQICFSFGDLIETDAAATEQLVKNNFKRMVVAEWNGAVWVFSVDELYGIQRFNLDDMRKAPETVIKSNRTYTRGVFNWQGKHAGYLDHELLFTALKKCLL